jgi:hypothetical protein
MKPKVYIETTIVSYLTARRRRDVVAAARQQVTVRWWDQRRAQFSLFVSEAVLAEAERGDAAAAVRRLGAVQDIPLLKVTDEAAALAERLVREGGLPAQAADDALHVGLAAVYRMDYLLTWNCRHLDNAETKPVMRTICMLAGYQCPEICSPDELMGDLNDA